MTYLMKRLYRRPELVVYGRLEELTLGNNGCDPDNANQPANPNISGDHGGPPSCGSTTS